MLFILFYFSAYGSERLLLVVDQAGETNRKAKEGLICVIWFLADERLN